MSRLKQVPLLKVFVLFSSGVLLAKYLYFVLNTEVIIGFVAFTIMVLCFTIISRFKFQSIFIPSVAIAIISLGALSYTLSDERYNADYFSRYINTDSFKKHKFIIKVKEIKKYNAGKIKLIANILGIVEKNDTISASGSLLVNTDIPIQYNKITTGDIIAFNSYVKPIKPARNPKSFDPKKYYQYQNIHFKSYLKSSDYNVVKRVESIKTFFKNINKSLQKTILKSIENTTNANIAISILLGDKQNIDKKLLNTFSTTGIRHILTVSGMHVGIVALILTFIFSFFKTKYRFIKPIKIVTILVSIWFYAFLTGAGTATLRASFMISLLIVGINLRKNVNTYNLLFGSALIILIINPYQLFQLGFILSYSAMLSILIFYPHIYKLINLKRIKVLDYIWQLLSLSIAAQILLFPLSIYYFHNAPSLFLLTALISTPMAFLTIALGFTIIVSSAFSTAIAIMFGHILNLIITYSLIFIKQVEAISFNIAQFIYLEPIDLIIIFLIIAFLYILIINKIYKYAYYTAFMLLLLFLNQISISGKTTELVIYSSYKNCIIDIFTPGKCYSMIDDNLSQSTIDYITKNNRTFKSVEQEKILKQFSTSLLTRKSNILEIEGKTIVLIENKDDLIPANRKTINLLLLKDNIKFDIKDLVKKYQINTIVTMNGMNYKLRNYWIKQASKAKIDYWDINEKGAFVSKIKSI